MPKKIVFTKSHFFWKEIMIFVETCLSRWTTDDSATSLHDPVIKGIQVASLILCNAGRLFKSIPVGLNYLAVAPKMIEFSIANPKTNDPQAYKIDYQDDFFVYFQQIIFGHAFERVRFEAVNKWGERRNWPDIFQFAYHIRNGCFHGNMFNITTSRMHGTPQWRSVVISMSMHGKKVMGFPDGVIGIADIPMLLYDLWEKVKK